MERIVHTPDTIADFCRRMRGMDIHEATDLGKGCGLPPNLVESLRCALGYTSRHARIPDENRERILEEEKSGAPIMAIAKKLGYRYATVWRVIHGSGQRESPAEFWTERKMMRMCQLVRDGVSNGDGAAILGTSKVRFQLTKSRLLRGKLGRRWADVVGKFGFRVSDR